MNRSESLYRDAPALAPTVLVSRLTPRAEYDAGAMTSPGESAGASRDEAATARGHGPARLDAPVAHPE